MHVCDARGRRNGHVIVTQSGLATRVIPPVPPSGHNEDISELKYKELQGNLKIPQTANSGDQ